MRCAPQASVVVVGFHLLAALYLVGFTIVPLFDILVYPGLS